MQSPLLPETFPKVDSEAETSPPGYHQEPSESSGIGSSGHHPFLLLWELAEHIFLHFLCIPSEPLAISATKEETSLSSASAVLALLVLKCEMFQKSPRACMYAGWKLGGVHAQWGRTLTHTA